MATGAIVARILTQYSDKGSKQAQKDIAKLGKTFDAYAKKASRAVGLVAVASAAAAVKIGKDSVMAASDVAQQFGALDAVFGSSAIQLKNFSKTMVEYGLSVADSARYSALLGTQLKGLGIEEQDAIERTQKLQILAADLAATYGGTTADAVAALSSTFKGEYNPIERYGFAIRNYDITARVAAKGLKGLTGEALKAAEAQAAYELILTKTTAAQGQSGREFNTLAAQLQRLNASYTNIQASLGEALLPVIQEFAGYLLKDVIPGIQKWVDVNRTDLAESLKRAAKLAGEFLKIAGKVTQWATNNVGVVKTIAAAIATIFVVNKLANFVTSITTMVTLLKGLKTQADLTNASTSKIGLLGKAGLAAAVASIAIPGAAELQKAAQNQLDNIKDLEKLERQLFAAQLRRDPLTQTMVKRRIEALKEELALVEKLRIEQSKFVGKGTIPYAIGMYTPSEYKKAQAEIDRIAAADAASAAASLKATEKSIAGEKKKLDILKRIAKFGINPKTGKGITPVSSIDAAEYEAINFRAAELLLIKQKDNQAEIEKLKALKENVLLQGIRNTLSERYKDILAALADAKIDSKDIATLAGKWGVTIEAAKSYIETIFAISDGTVSDEEVTNLAKSWGSTKEQAAKYLDFFTYLNDGILSDAEIEKLRTKWGLTEAQVRQYADFVGVVSDGKLDDSEVKKLMDKWKMTTDQVVAYLYQLGAPVTYNGNLIEPGRLAELAWKSATAALEEYLRKLGQGTTSSSSSGPAYDPKASADANKEAADAWAAANDAAAEAAKAESEATKAANAAANKIAALVTTMDLKKASGRSYLTDAEMDRVLAASNSPYAPAMNDSAAFADERSKFQQKYGISPTIATASTIGTSSSNSGVVVNLTVNGSVSTEQDLVSAVRNGLLATQTNGNGLTLQAV
jgi:hypothetical protein